MTCEVLMPSLPASLLTSRRSSGLGLKVIVFVVSGFMPGTNLDCCKTDVNRFREFIFALLSSIREIMPFLPSWRSGLRRPPASGG